MGTERNVPGFELSVSGRSDGTLEAAYIRFKDGKVARTAELVEDTVMADYDSHGGLLGIEVLAPAKLSVLAKLVDERRRLSFRRFVRGSISSELVYV